MYDMANLTKQPCVQTSLKPSLHEKIVHNSFLVTSINTNLNDANNHMISLKTKLQGIILPYFYNFIVSKKSDAIEWLIIAKCDTVIQSFAVNHPSSLAFNSCELLPKGILFQKLLPQIIISTIAICVWMVSVYGFIGNLWYMFIQTSKHMELYSMHIYTSSFIHVQPPPVPVYMHHSINLQIKYT